MMMLDVDPKIKKKKGAEFFERPEDLDNDWVKQHQEAEVEELRQKITKKFEKDNEKLALDGDKEMKPKELEERLTKANELADKYKKENKTGKVEAEGKGATVEKLEGNVEKIMQRIENMKIQMEDKEGNKEVALGTSKIVGHVRVRCTSKWLISTRTTSTLVSRLSSPRSSTFPLKSSSPRLFARSSTGLLNLSTRTGSFEVCCGSQEAAEDWCDFLFQFLHMFIRSCRQKGASMDRRASFASNMEVHKAWGHNKKGEAFLNELWYNASIRHVRHDMAAAAETLELR